MEKHRVIDCWPTIRQRLLLYFLKFIAGVLTIMKIEKNQEGWGVWYLHWIVFALIWKVSSWSHALLWFMEVWAVAFGAHHTSMFNTYGCVHRARKWSLLEFATTTGCALSLEFYDELFWNCCVLFLRQLHNIPASPGRLCTVKSYNFCKKLRLHAIALLCAKGSTHHIERQVVWTIYCCVVWIYIGPKQALFHW